MDIDSRSVEHLDLFEDRYGRGAHDRLLALLRQPCVTFAEIATRFGVTRECVRQWHQRLLPDAPSGHARQRLCRLSQRRQRVMTDPLFNAFYRRLRTSLPDRRIALLPARDGFRKRTVTVDGLTILLKKARLVDAATGDRPHATYVLTNGSTPVDFIYYELTATDYVFLPRTALAPRGTMFVDGGRSKYQRYRNTFAALAGTAAHDVTESPDVKGQRAKVKGEVARSQVHQVQVHDA